MNPQPLDNRVLIKPDPLDKQSAGGIYIPDTATQYDKKRSGIVIAHGKGHIAEQTGELIPITVWEGCRVSFPVGAGGEPLIGKEIGFDNEDEYLLMRESDIDFIMYEKKNVLDMEYVEDFNNGYTAVKTDRMEGLINPSFHKM